MGKHGTPHPEPWENLGSGAGKPQRDLMVKPTNFVFGSVCEAHPELRGKRYAKGHNCVACLSRRTRKYYKDNWVYRRAGLGTPADVGQACEYFVASDLLRRGLLVTKPLNTNGKHDLHAKCGTVWVTIQVKAAKLNTKTGEIAPNHAANITSDVLVAVDLIDRRLRYIPFNIPELPEELRDADLRV